MIRFSAIGDIILTTPVLKYIKLYYPNAEIVYVVKKAYLPILDPNPHITKLLAYEGDLRETIHELKKEKFDFCLDLQANLRSLRIKSALNCRYATVDKCNWTKWQMVHLKSKKQVSPIGSRYLQTLKPLGINENDFTPEIYLTAQQEQNAINVLAPFLKDGIPFYGLVLGATYTTKRWLDAYFAPFINLMGEPVVLFGGKSEEPLAESITNQINVPFINTVGKTDFLTSAAILKHCTFVFTHDTGLMHVADAFHLPTAILWGNTVPEFGFEPLHTRHLNLQAAHLDCRPCSKIGYQHCPKKHFRCMKELTPIFVKEQIETWLAQ